MTHRSHPFARFRYGWAILGGVATAFALAGVLSLTHRVAHAGLRAAGVAPMQAAPAPVRTLDDLVALTSGQLESLYRQGVAGSAPTGRVRGLALYPDARFPRARSRAARVAWQGKVFDPESGTATNRFFGLKVIRGTVYSGQSWLDGGSSLILDYQATSQVYGNYRDEIRQVAPGVYLGLMYDRTTSPPAFKMYFAFSDH